MTSQRLILSTTLALAAMISGGCMSSPVIPPFASSGYHNTSAPVDITFKEGDLGTREGRATSRSFFGLFAFGDASTDAAARNGGLTTVDHIDCRMTHVLFGIYASYETIVTGS